VTTLLSAVVAHVESLTARISALEGEIATLRTENAALQAKLETNSRTSGKPPSSDGPGVKPHPQSQRVRSGRLPGGQIGHAGHSVPFVEEPDEVQEHAPAQCAGCGQSVEGIPAQRWERRQVVDIPPCGHGSSSIGRRPPAVQAVGVRRSARFPPVWQPPCRMAPGWPRWRCI